LLKYFTDKVQCLIGSLKIINTTTTVTSIVDKIMVDMSSFSTTSVCTNNFCLNQQNVFNSTKLSVNKYNEEFSIQNEIDEYTNQRQEE